MYGRLGVWPIGGRIPFIKRCKELFFVHHRSKYVQYVIMNPGSQMEGARLRRRPGARDLSKAARTTHRCSNCPVPSHKHCSQSLRGGGGELGGGGREATWGNAKRRSSPDLGILASSVPAPPSDTPRGEEDSHGVCKSKAGKNVTRPVCPCRTALLAMCKSHGGASTSHSASPCRGHPAGFARPGQNAPSHPQRDRSGQSSSRGARRCAAASRGWRTQTSTNKRVV